MKQIKEKLKQELEKKGFKSMITLTYPLECYPKEEKNIKEHLLKFIGLIRKIKRLAIYFYVYELHKNNNIHIHMLVQIDKSQELFKLKKSWSRIIGTEKEQAMNFKKPEVEDITYFCNYILKTIGNKELENKLYAKLGNNSRLVGSSKELQYLLKELRQPLIDVSINFNSLSTDYNLSDLVIKITDEYKIKYNISEELILEELNSELQSYTEVLNTLQYQNLEEFLKKGKWRVSKGYLKFYLFVKEISKDALNSFNLILKEWYNKKERKTPIVELLSIIFNLKENEIKLENNLLILATSLDFLIKWSLRGIPIVKIYEKLGNALINSIDSKILTKYEITINDYYRTGSIIVLIIKKLFENKLKFEPIEISNQIEETLSEIIDISLDTPEVSISATQTLLFDFNLHWINDYKFDKNLTKKVISNLLVIQKPMLVPPKDWTIKTNAQVELTSNNIELYNAKDILYGGYLLNGYYFNKVIQKNIENSNLHKLAISKNCIVTINKIQKIAYEVNTNLLWLLKNNKNNLPDYLNTVEIKKLIKVKSEKLIILKEWYQKRLRYLKENINTEPIYENIKNLKLEIEDISWKLTKHEVLNRVLTNFEELSQYSSFYYSFDLDFRMRMYPQQVELSPQGSKLSRSLIKFKEKFEFNYNEFKIYSTKLYLKIYNFDELTLNTIFRGKIQIILNKFIEEEEEAIKIILKEAAEPYLFLAVAIEYKNYKVAEWKGEKYMTGFPIILDCWGSGPQILSLLFLMDDFSKYLNLEPSEERKDFYTSIINKFLSNQKDFTIISEKLDELLLLLRRICKQSIMTQIYGVSYRKFNNDIEHGLKRYKEKILQCIIIEYEYEKFINVFISSFWKYQRGLSLYKLREFFQIVVNSLSKADKELSWTILDQSKIHVNYQQSIKKRLDFKENILGRNQFITYESIEKKNYTKIKSSAQANFIHSIDAAVNMYILEKQDSPIFPIHDAWVIPLGKSKELQEKIKEIYFKIWDKNLLLKKLIDEFVLVLTEAVWKEAAMWFKEYCEANIEIGNYDPSLLENCKFMLYY